MQHRRQAVQAVDEPGVAQVVEQHADHVGAPLGELTGDGVGPVAQLVDGPLHGMAFGVADVRRTAEHQRDQGLRDPGAVGDGADGGRSWCCHGPPPDAVRVWTGLDNFILGASVTTATRVLCHRPRDRDSLLQSRDFRADKAGFLRRTLDSRRPGLARCLYIGPVHKGSVATGQRASREGRSRKGMSRDGSDLHQCRSPGLSDERARPSSRSASRWPGSAGWAGCTPRPTPGCCTTSRSCRWRRAWSPSPTRCRAGPRRPRASSASPRPAGTGVSWPPTPPCRRSASPRRTSCTRRSASRWPRPASTSGSRSPSG